MVGTHLIDSAVLTRPAGLLVALLLAPLLTGCVESRPRSTATGWFVSDLATVTPDSTANSENEVYSAGRGGLRLQAAVNETLGVQASLRSTVPGRFRVECSDLRSSAGMIAAADNLELLRILPVQLNEFCSWYADHGDGPALPRATPDILAPLEGRASGTVTLEAEHSTLLWLDVHVPGNTAPGEYEGEFRLIAEGQTVAAWTTHIRVQVLPISLPAAPQLAALARFDPTDLLAEVLKWPIAAPEETLLLRGDSSQTAAVRLVDEGMALLHAHRLNPVLWASFPKYRMSGERAVEVNWSSYDELVSGYIDGSAYPDHVPAAAWPLPVSENYPSAERNGGFATPRYARVLGAFAAECRKHFEACKWSDKAFARICGPTALTQEAVERVRRAASILRQNEITTPLAVHLPINSLRSFGWRDAPPIDMPDVRLWAPPARWADPLALQRERGLAKRVWIMPDYAPYCGSLAREAPATDAAILGWMAHRYSADGLWIENVAAIRSRPTNCAEPVQGAALIYPGTAAGMPERILPSIRLKRLRRGLQDYDLLARLEAVGKPLLARRTSEQLVRWALLEACTENLVTCRPVGFSSNPSALHLARTLLRQELANLGDSQEQAATLTDWARLMAENPTVSGQFSGVRVTALGNEAAATATLHVTSSSDKAFVAGVNIPELPAGWRLQEPVHLNLAAFGVGEARLALHMTSLTTNADGVAPFAAMIEAQDVGNVTVAGRLAVTSCPFVDKPPVLNGDLSDWSMGVNNAAGDFRLVRGTRSGAPAGADRASSPTQVYFCTDRVNLYIAAVCALPPGEKPHWRADNMVEVDGSIPWGDELLEVLLDPRESGAGSASDLYLLQIKPSGLVLSHKGCPTEPPTATVSDWQSGARVAIGARPDAWVMELSLPLASLGPTASKTRVWGANVTHFDAQHMEYSSWSGARQTCYSPASLGNLIMVGP